MTDYKVEIIDTSRELSKRERVALKTGTPKKIVDLEDGTILKIREHARLRITNEQAADGEYISNVFITEEGEMYSTSSDAFYRSYVSIWNEMDGEEFDVAIYRIPGKKGTNNETLLCRLV